MLELLPKDLLDGFRAARRRQARRRSRLHIRVGEAVFPILRQWPGGFSLDATSTPRLRGLVDLYDGPRHILQGLIVAWVETDAGAAEADEIRCEFKHVTFVAEGPAADFWRGEPGPVGFLGYIPADQPADHP